MRYSTDPPIDERERFKVLTDTIWLISNVEWDFFNLGT